MDAKPNHQSTALRAALPAVILAYPRKWAPVSLCCKGHVGASLLLRQYLPTISYDHWSTSEAAIGQSLEVINWPRFCRIRTDLMPLWFTQTNRLKQPERTTGKLSTKKSLTIHSSGIRWPCFFPFGESSAESQYMPGTISYLDLGYI